jgi:ParB-like chromosome segregation protein Spo0J
VSGFRRHAALSFLARTKGIAPSAYPVKVSVLPDGTTDDEALRVSFAENLARKTLDATEKAIAVVRLRDEFGKTNEEIAALVRVGRSNLQKLTDLVAAPEDVRATFRVGRLALKHALALAGDADEGPEPAPADDPVEENPLPEKVRPFARLSRTQDPVFPLRLVVRFRDEAAARKVVRHLVRIA